MRSLAVVTVLLAAMSGQGSSRVLKVFPADGSMVSAPPIVGAELDLTKGEPVDPSSLRLFLDGADVTARATVTQTRDWPPSFVSISYKAHPLETGRHKAEVRLQTQGGKAVSHAWSFVLSSP